MALAISPMIEQFEAMSLLVAACPSFDEEWREHLSVHGNDLLYSAAGSYARHLLALQQAHNTTSFPAVAAAIERLHSEGSPWVREFATIGVLEGVQNSWSNNSVDPEIFAQFLGPESLRWWRGLTNFWSGAAPAVRTDG